MAIMALILLAGILLGVVISSLYRSTNKNRRYRGLLSGRGKRREAMRNALSIHLDIGPNFVAVGGGTGLSSLLLGLKSYTRNITAVVTVTDEGGSSGRLIRDWGMLPPGDIRNCLVALSQNDSKLRDFLNFRFDKGELAGHSLGNLILLAATEETGDFKLAVELMNDLLAIRGRVLPITTENVTLMAETYDGETLRGELEIASRGKDICTLYMEPSDAKAVPEILDAVDIANMTILGPGSLFTSVLPNLLIEDFCSRVAESRAPIIYVANLMTQPGETEGMSLFEHILWIVHVLGKFPDGVVVNEDHIPGPLLERYRSQGADVLHLSREEEALLQDNGCTVYRTSLLQIKDGSVVRHNSNRLAEILMRIQRKYDNAVV